MSTRLRKTTKGGVPALNADAGGNYKTAVTLAADEVVADLPYVSLRFGGFLAIQGIIHNVSGLANAPTDTPVGVFELWASADDTNYSLVPDAAVKLANIAPNGNNVVSSWAVFENAPGTRIKVRWNNTSGGAGDSRCTMNIVTDGDLLRSDT
jgi:hypothetical protein